MAMSDSWRFPVEPMDESNKALLSNVHPDKWNNPEPAHIYNLVVVGAGTAGLVSAIGAAGLGAKVALVERHMMGGDCLNVGCVPSKSLIRPARLAHEMKTAARLGLTGADTRPEDFPRIMERLRKIRAGISPHDSARRFTEAGVDVFFGEGRFAGPDSVEVEGKTLRFKKAVIATGARAVHPDIEGLAEVGFLTNETVFNLTTLPGSLLVIGGGPIGCELAQAFHRLGSKVVIVSRGAFLSREDQDASELLAKVFRKEGLETRINSRPLRAHMANGKKMVTITTENGEETMECDEILIGAGRKPNVDGLGLEAAGVAYDPAQGVEVDDYLRSSNPNIYAAGDVCMAHKFTHAADAAARIVLKNALFRGRARLSALNMPWATYTEPEIAHVGMYEHDAREQGIETSVYKVEMSGNDRAIADGEDEGFVKVVVKKGSDKIVGATIVAAHAGEMISEISVAMSAGMGLGGLANVIHPYPTQAEAIKRVADAYNKTRLTPFVKKIFRWWLSWSRG
ncbi:MAG: mercuric reductase [Nitrospinota bacterium]|nr:mercuric reductase [Nitrospinota bacterium]